MNKAQRRHRGTTAIQFKSPAQRQALTAEEDVGGLPVGGQEQASGALCNFIYFNEPGAQKEDTACGNPSKFVPTLLIHLSEASSLALIVHMLRKNPQHTSSQSVNILYAVLPYLVAMLASYVFPLYDLHAMWKNQELKKRKDKADQIDPSTDPYNPDLSLRDKPNEVDPEHKITRRKYWFILVGLILGLASKALLVAKYVFSYKKILHDINGETSLVMDFKPYLTQINDIHTSGIPYYIDVGLLGTVIFGGLAHYMLQNEMKGAKNHFEKYLSVIDTVILCGGFIAARLLHRINEDEYYQMVFDYIQFAFAILAAMRVVTALFSYFNCGHCRDFESDKHIAQYYKPFDICCDLFLQLLFGAAYAITVLFLGKTNEMAVQCLCAIGVIERLLYLLLNCRTLSINRYQPLPNKKLDGGDGGAVDGGQVVRDGSSRRDEWPYDPSKLPNKNSKKVSGSAVGSPTDYRALKENPIGSVVDNGEQGEEEFSFSRSSPTANPLASHPSLPAQPPSQPAAPGVGGTRVVGHPLLNAVPTPAAAGADVPFKRITIEPIPQPDAPGQPAATAPPPSSAVAAMANAMKAAPGGGPPVKLWPQSHPQPPAAGQQGTSVTAVPLGPSPAGGSKGPSVPPPPVRQPAPPSGSPPAAPPPPPPPPQ